MPATYNDRSILKPLKTSYVSEEQLMYQYRVTGNTRYRDYATEMDLASCKDYNDFKLPQYINSRP